MFGADTWVLTEKMIHQLEGSHVSLLMQVTRKHTTRQRDGSWRQVTTEAFLQEVGTQTLRTYVERQQAKVAKWVSTRPVFGVCARDTGYE